MFTTTFLIVILREKLNTRGRETPIDHGKTASPPSMVKYVADRILYQFYWHLGEKETTIKSGTTVDISYQTLPGGGRPLPLIVSIIQCRPYFVKDFGENPDKSTNGT